MARRARSRNERTPDEAPNSKGAPACPPDTNDNGLTRSEGGPRKRPTARDPGSSVNDRAVLAAALEPIITIDIFGTIRSASDSVHRVLGWSPAELRGQNVSILMPEPHRSAHEQYLANYRRTGTTNILGRTREFEAVRKSGERIPIELSVSRADPDDGGLPLFVGIIRDISERKRMERELRLVKDLALSMSSAADLHRALLDTLRLVCLATEWDYGEAWLPTADESELAGAACWVRPESGLDAFAATMDQIRFRRGSGLVGRAWASGAPEWAGDIAALKEAEFCRPAAAARAGLRAATAVPVLSEDRPVAVLMFFVRATRREDLHLLELVRAGVAPLGTLIQRKRAEEALRRSEENLAQELTSMVRLNELVSRLLACRDVPGALDEIMHAAIGLTGGSAGSIHLQESGSERLQLAAQVGLEEDRMRDLRELRLDDGSAFSRAMNLGKQYIVAEVQGTAAPGPQGCAAAAAGFGCFHATPLLSSGGELLGVLSIYTVAHREPTSREIRAFDLYTREAAGFLERDRVGARARESEARLRLALRAAGGGFWDWDLVSGIAHWSAEMYEVWGIPPGRRMDLEHSLALIHEEDRSRVQEAVRLAISANEPYICEFRIHHPSRRERWMIAHGQIVKGLDGRPRRLIGICLDITSQRGAQEELRSYRDRLERLVAERTAELMSVHEQLRMADRMASIGTLAAGLGHDMNNVLLPVRARLNALRAACQERDLPKTQWKHIEEIQKSIAYLQQLADGLHFLALDPEAAEDTRGGGGSTDLRTWWSQAGAILSKAVPRHVRITASFPRDLPPVAIAAHSLTQAVLNLVVNAGEAIPPPGERRRQQGMVQISARASMDEHHEWVRLSVADNGTGMTEEVKRRAFEVFFTTKQRGLGTGLGLSLVRMVVDRAGGRISVHSQPGKGTRINLFLPAVRLGARGPSAPSAAAMVFIDDGRPASLVRHLLESAGTQVRSDGDPAAAEIWIVTPRAKSIGEVKRWRRARPNGRLVLFGPPDPDVADDWRELNPITIQSPDDLESVRAAISNAVSIHQE